MARGQRLVIPLSFVLFALPPAVAVEQPALRDTNAAVAFFEANVRPLLADNCYNCHSADTNAKGGLRLDDRNGMIQGGGRGPAIAPFHPEKSLLLRAVAYTDPRLQMPPKKRLSAEQITILTKWIKDGAAWPQVKVPVVRGKRKAKYEKLRTGHWAWQPRRHAKVPVVRDSAWARDDVDRFILAKLEQKGLRPVRDADRQTLIRRVTFDLTGLPPTPEEIDAFLKNATAGAFAKVVDRLLASPAFGERWGRHWLDVARYGESTGSARNVPYPQAWRYRDYVISALSKDKPYDRFLCEQIAGDLLPAKSQAQRDERLVATGFLALGVKDVNQRFKVRFIMDNIDEQIDTVSRSVLALTVSCARCHDHKFDPIPSTEYYALAGIFNSTDLCAGVRNKMGGGGLDYYDPEMLVRLGPPTRPDPRLAGSIAAVKKELAKARAEVKAAGNKAGGGPKRTAAQQKINRLQNELFQLTDPAATSQVALGVRDAREVGDTALRIRGEAEKLGPLVPRGFLSILDIPNPPKINPKQSGRVELAAWLTNPHNPLTPRVMVNRVWHHLFGQGLVSSVDNFGVTGDVPSHPNLLEYLAARFVADGWSIKKLVRALVMTRGYQLDSQAPADHMTADPANRLVWRHSPRRLEAEEIRDAMLTAAGTLNHARPEGSPVKQLKVMEMANNGPEAGRISAAALASQHRGIYLPLVRNLIPKGLEVFDFAEQGMVTGRRETTTVAPQALYMLNDPFVRREALAFADRLLRRAELDDPARIRLAYRLTVGRPPTAKEAERIQNHLADYQSTARKLLDAAPAARPTPRAANETKVQANGSALETLTWPADPRVCAWASFCQVMFASAEFRYVQ
jgi:hypothetical protein